MLSVQDAMRQVIDRAQRSEARRTPVSEAQGLLLAAEVLSDVDIPPFDRAAMDGYALRAEDTEHPPTSLSVVGEVSAGQFPTFRVGAGEAAIISTGAPIPPGANCVQPIEKVKEEEGRVILFEPISPGKHIAPKAVELAASQVALPAGTTLGPAALGVLAMVGCTEILAYPRPRVAIGSTGSELVPADQIPGPGQIRNSNTPMLAAAVAQLGACVETLGSAQDTDDSLEKLLEQGLQRDVLLLTGGVSAGRHDLVEDALERMGVKIHFRSVAIKPGKPVTFGSHSGGLVFGLPGNPVSALVTFHLFAATAIRKLMGLPNASGMKIQATLSKAFEHHGDRVGFFTAWTDRVDHGFRVRRIEAHGSADLIAATRANSLVICPKGENTFEEGAILDVMLLPDFPRY